MRIAALVLSVIAAAPAALEAGGLSVTALSHAFFGATSVCAAGGPECTRSVAEPADFLALLPFIAIFGFVAVGSMAGGLLSLRRPRTGAVVLAVVGVLGAATILVFIPPVWTVLDLVAAGLAFGASRQKPQPAGPQPERQS